MLDHAAPTLGADLAYNSTWDGRAVGIAVIDSGITQVEDLLKRRDQQQSNEAGLQRSFVPGDKKTNDAYGHGNHVAGIVLGNGNASTGVSYTRIHELPEANLINLRVLNNYGMGTDSAIAAIERAIALKFTYNIRVINLSLGRPVFESYPGSFVPGR